MAHEVESMFYAGEVPWHELGVGVEKAKTAAQAMKLAGIDWEVELGPVYGGTKKVEDTSRRAICRVTDGAVLGVVSPTYQLFQNKEAFDFLDSLLQDGTMVYETAGSLRGGKRIWALARLAEGMRVLDDEYIQYMLITTAHGSDGQHGGSIIVQPTETRVVCNNTLDLAIRGSASKGATVYRIGHRRGMQSKLEQARQALLVTTESSRRLKEWLEEQAKVKVSDQKVKALTDEVFGSLDEASSAQRRRAVAEFMAIYKAEAERQGKTAYSVIQAVVGYADHATRYKGSTEQRAESRFEGTLVGGRTRRFKQDAVAVLSGLTK